MSVRVRIDRSDLLVSGNLRYRQLWSKNGERRLENVDSGMTETISDDRFSTLTSHSSYRRHPGHFDGGTSGERSDIPAPSVSSLNRRDRKILLRRLEYVHRAIRANGQRQLTLNDDALEAFAQRVQPEIDKLGLMSSDRDLAPDEVAGSRRKPRVGQPIRPADDVNKFNGVSWPCGRTLRRWITTYRRSFSDPMSLKPDYNKSGNFGSHLAPEVEAIITEEVKHYLTREQLTPTHIHDRVKVRVKRYNRDLASRRQTGTAHGDDKRLLEPGIQAIQHAIDQFDPYYVDLMRYGPGYAKAKHGWESLNTPEIRVPGQRVEIDAYRVHLRTLMCWSGAWAFLTEDEKRKVKKCRRWLTIAIDRATRIILAMWLHDTPDAPNAVEVLAMVESDKSRYSTAAGCQSVWSQRCGVMTAVMDGAYVSTEIRAALADARATAEYPQAETANNRGVVERIFRTISVKLIDMLFGKTFSNVVLRRHYNSDEHAVWSVDELGWALVTWVVDFYHNTEHHELGCTPAEAWTAAEKAYSITPPRDAHGRRTAFGIRLQRELQRSGFTVLGNEYRDDEEKSWLKSLFQSSHDRKFTICIDPQNLGSISVLTGDRAYDVPCADPKMEGVHIADWMETVEHVRRENPNRRNIEREFAWEALERILKKNQELGMRSAVIVSRTPSAEIVTHYEKIYTRDLAFIEAVPGEPSDVLGTSVAALSLTSLPDFDEEEEGYGEPPSTRSHQTKSPAPSKKKTPQPKTIKPARLQARKMED